MNIKTIQFRNLQKTHLEIIMILSVTSIRFHSGFKKLMRAGSVVKQYNLERCCILIMKLHVSASNGHHQVYTPIKKILYICVGEC
jgi:hypothetical protein